MEDKFFTKDYIDKSQGFLNEFRMNADSMQRLFDKTDAKYIIFADRTPCRYYGTSNGNMLLIRDEYGNPKVFYSDDGLRYYLREFATDDEIESAVLG